MVPGGVLARILIGLGARWIKVEDPAGGDPLRSLEPRVEGTGAGFAAYFGGAESVALDLRTPGGVERVRQLARHADVLVESFRPGVLEAWGLAPDAMLEDNRRLILCSLPGFARLESSERSQAGDLVQAAGGRTHDSRAHRTVGHDLDFTAISGLLGALGALPQPGTGESREGAWLPAVQLADVTAGIMASSAILAALLERSRTGRGRRVEQPLLSGAMAFMTWLFADAEARPVAAGEPSPGPGATLRGEPSGTPTGLLAGRCPAYNVYRCADGLQLAVAAVEPKFWQRFVTLVGLLELAPLGLELGAAGIRARRILADRLAQAPRAHWLALAAGQDLPVSAVNSVEGALADPAIDPASCLAIGPWQRPPQSRCPALGADTERILAEFSASPSEPLPG